MVPGRLLPLLALLGCTKTEQRKVDPEPVPVPLPTPIVPRPTLSRKVLLEAHTPTLDKARYLAVELGKDPATAPKLDDLGERPALAISTWQGHYRTVATQDGERWVSALAGNKLAISVVSSVSGGKPSYQLPIAVEPRGLHLVGDALFIGSPAAVGWIDLAAARPTYVELVKRDGYREKAYDLFVHDGDRLVAIDDEVMPMFADWFSLDPSGHPIKRLGDWKMPGVINGHYAHAALLPVGANKWTLFVIAPYDILPGSGHDLAALPIEDDKLVFEPRLMLPDGDGKTPVVEEHQPRGDGKRTLLGGSTPTEWTGMAVAAGKVVVAAGERGLMSLPARFPAGTTSATFTEVAASNVRDVREHAGKLLVLVEHTTAAVAKDPRSHLIIVDPGSMKVLAEHTLPGSFDRFVR